MIYKGLDRDGLKTKTTRQLRDELDKAQFQASEACLRLMHAEPRYFKRQSREATRLGVVAQEALQAWHDKVLEDDT